MRCSCKRNNLGPVYRCSALAASARRCYYCVVLQRCSVLVVDESCGSDDSTTRVFLASAQRLASWTQPVGLNSIALQLNDTSGETGLKAEKNLDSRGLWFQTRSRAAAFICRLPFICVLEALLSTAALRNLSQLYENSAAALCAHAPRLTLLHTRCAVGLPQPRFACVDVAPRALRRRARRTAAASPPRRSRANARAVA